jgi:hypothetical protein
MNGFLCAAIGFSLVDMLNRGSRFSLSLSPFYMSIAAFCFSMTIGVLWEFFEFAMDFFFRFDMQKDTILSAISTVNLDPAGGVHPVVEQNISDLILVYNDGSQKALGLGGFLDIGLFDTMQDLFVNFVGAVIFSVVGYFYVKTRGKGNFAKRFIPRVFTHREIESQNKEDKE